MTSIQQRIQESKVDRRLLERALKSGVSIAVVIQRRIERGELIEPLEMAEWLALERFAKASNESVS